MKSIVFSDSHGDRQALLRAVAVTGPDMILHLGDGVRDCVALFNNFPQIPLRRVRGNCDFGSNEPLSDEFVCGEKRIFMAHGHSYNVKCGTTAIVNAAMYRDADILLFGHTHMPWEENFEGLLIINPGSIGRGMRTYGVLTIEKGYVNYEQKNLEI